MYSYTASPYVLHLLVGVSHKRSNAFHHSGGFCKPNLPIDLHRYFKSMSQRRTFVPLPSFRNSWYLSEVRSTLGSSYSGTLKRVPLVDLLNFQEHSGCYSFHFFNPPVRQQSHLLAWPIDLRDPSIAYLFISSTPTAFMNWSNPLSQLVSKSSQHVCFKNIV